MAGEAPSVIVFGPFAWREVDRQWWIKARAKAAAELERGHVDTDKQWAESRKLETHSKQYMLRFLRQHGFDGHVTRKGYRPSVGSRFDG